MSSIINTYSRSLFNPSSMRIWGYTSSGYLTLISLIILLMFSTLLLIMAQVYIGHSRHVDRTAHYLKAYAISLSGLRLVDRFIDDIPVSYAPHPSLVPSSIFHTVAFNGFVFNYFRTDTHLYSYATSKHQQCMLKASYSIGPTDVVLSELEFSYRRRP